MIDRPLALVVAEIDGVVSRLGTRALLVGAYARDLCLSAEGASTRGTRDADFAILLDSWAQVDSFFSTCIHGFRDIDRSELKMYHRSSGLKVDIVPCGPIETPTGMLILRGSPRRLNTAGLAECFDLGRPLDPGFFHVLVPPPAGFIVLKLMAFADRRERRDLRDLGHVLGRMPIDEARVWSDEDLMAGFADGTLTYDDLRPWQAGRAIALEFSSNTVHAVTAALDGLRREPPELRSFVLEDAPSIDPDERVARADRTIAVLRRACAT